MQIRYFKPFLERCRKCIFLQFDDIAPVYGNKTYNYRCDKICKEAMELSEKCGIDVKDDDWLETGQFQMKQGDK